MSGFTVTRGVSTDSYDDANATYSIKEGILAVDISDPIPIGGGDPELLKRVLYAPGTWFRVEWTR